MYPGGTSALEQSNTSCLHMQHTHTHTHRHARIHTRTLKHTRASGGANAHSKSNDCATQSFTDRVARPLNNGNRASPHVTCNNSQVHMHMRMRAFLKSTAGGQKIVINPQCGPLSQWQHLECASWRQTWWYPWPAPLWHWSRRSPAASVACGPGDWSPAPRSLRKTGNDVQKLELHRCESMSVGVLCLRGGVLCVSCACAQREERESKPSCIIAMGCY